MDRDERTTPTGTVDRLLQEGLDLYHSGLVDHAVAVWTEAVHVQPDDPRARDYLRQAGVAVDETDSPVPLSGTRAELEQLLAERRYEEALELLFTARRQNPSAPEISRGIQLLKQRLVRRYLHQIGNLDHVPKLAVAEKELEGRKLEEEERELLRLVDGISSFGDIAHESRLGRFETFRILAKLVGEQVITQAVEERDEDEDAVAPPATAVTMVAELPDASEVGPTPEEMSGETPVSAPQPQAARRRAWPFLLGLGIVAATGIVVVLLLDRESPSVPREATAAAVAAQPVLPAPAPELPKPPAQPEPPVALAAPDAPSVAAAEPEPEPTIEIEPTPPASPASPPPARVAVKPRAPLRVAAATRRPDATPTKSDEPAEAPATPEPAPETPNPNPNPNPSPNPNPNPPPSPTPPPSPPPPPARLDAHASVVLESVAGALTRSEVDRALARIAPAFRACYASAAARAQKNAAGTVRLSFIVDETGLAQSPEAGPAPLPGLSNCLRDTLRQLRTQLAPDVGVVRVTANVTFTPPGP